MTSSLVGSEMCIRDRSKNPQSSHLISPEVRSGPKGYEHKWCKSWSLRSCLLYTSDAADDM
eukprot:6684786-Prorocentrum_lima.AAC.1